MDLLYRRAELKGDDKALLAYETLVLLGLCAGVRRYRDWDRRGIPLTITADLPGADKVDAIDIQRDPVAGRPSVLFIDYGELPIAQNFMMLRHIQERPLVDKFPDSVELPSMEAMRETLFERLQRLEEENKRLTDLLRTRGGLPR